MKRPKVKMKRPKVKMKRPRLRDKMTLLKMSWLMTMLLLPSLVNLSSKMMTTTSPKLTSLPSSEGLTKRTFVPADPMCHTGA